MFKFEPSLFKQMNSPVKVTFQVEFFFSQIFNFFNEFLKKVENCEYIYEVLMIGHNYMLP
jgi:hypothetical protein